MKYLKLVLVMLLVVCMAIPVLVACDTGGTPEQTTAQEGENTGPETLPPVVTGEIFTDKTEFEIKSGVR